jgi:hypothetical protein
VLKCNESKLIQAISKLITKAGNLELKIDVLSAYQAKFGRVTKKTTQKKQNEFFEVRRQECSPIISKIAIFLCI